MKKRKPLLYRVGAGVMVLLMLAVLGFGIRYLLISQRLKADAALLVTDPELRAPVILDDTPTVRQTITCGYAAIQWLTGYLATEVSEEVLFELHEGRIRTAFPGDFGPELAVHLGEDYRVTTLSNTPAQELLRAIHASLRAGMPVPISLAAIDDTNRPHYSLHYSVITGMDLLQDRIYISNVYGYEETYTLTALLEALRFDNYVDMPLFIRAGIFFGWFDRNTIYIIEPR